MILFRCESSCGANLEVSDGTTICVCKYCGTSQTVKNPNDIKQEEEIEKNLKEGFLNLEDGDWIGADVMFDMVIDENPEEYRAYIGRLCVEMKAHYEEDLAKVDKPIKDSVSFKRACRYGGKEVEARLNGYVEQHEYNKNMKVYESALKKMKEAKKASDFKAAAKEFESISGFKNAAQRAEECRQKAEECKQNEEEAREKEYNDALRKMKEITSSKAFEELKERFKALGKYKDSEKLAEECSKNILTAKEREYWESIRNCKKGDVIKFGRRNWIVIDQHRNNRTLLCENVISSVSGYHDRYRKRNVFDKVIDDWAGHHNVGKIKVRTTWENCDIRQHLNTSFLDEFPEEERKLICKTKIETPDNPEFHTPGGKSTEDYAFLLSIQEAQKLDRGILTINQDWWLRSPGSDYPVTGEGKHPTAAYVDKEGKIHMVGYMVDEVWSGVRPVIIIKVD